MKCVDRKTFLALPEGTICFKGRPWRFDGLRIKGETRGDIYDALDPAWVDAPDSIEAIELLERMLKTGESGPMEDAYDICSGHDGKSEEEALFLVLEAEDLFKLRGWIDAALKQCAGQAEGPLWPRRV